MVLTVEPGIYIRPSPRIPKEFWNIGIRIEDEVLVTNGCSGSADRGSREDPGGDRGAGAGGLMRSAATPSFDITIVGGGMVGASLAVALAPLGLKVALLEAIPHDSAVQPSFDERTTALSNGSRRILETLGVWDGIEASATPIRKIHVSDQGRFGFARIDAAEQGLAAMGYVVPNRALGRALWAPPSRQTRRPSLLPCRGVAASATARIRLPWRSPRPARRSPSIPGWSWLPTACNPRCARHSGWRRRAATMSRRPSSPRCCRSASTITWRTRGLPTPGRWRCCRSRVADAPWY